MDRGKSLTLGTLARVSMPGMEGGSDDRRIVRLILDLEPGDTTSGTVGPLMDRVSASTDGSV